MSYHLFNPCAGTLFLVYAAASLAVAEESVSSDTPRVQRVTLAQIFVTQDVEKNMRQIRSAFAQARNDRAQWVHLPEGAVSGYYGGFDQGEVAKAFEEIKTLCLGGRVTGIIGTCWKEEGKTTNEIRVIDKKGKLAGRYAKRCLTYSDAEQFEVGTLPLVHRVAGLTCGTLICNDLWVTPGYTDGPNPHLTFQQSKLGAQVIFHSVASGSDQRFRAYHESNLKLRAAEASCPIVVVNAAQETPVNCTSGVVQDFRYTVTLPRMGKVIQTVEFTPSELSEKR